MSLNKILKNPKRNTWLVDALNTNAYYSLYNNAIMIPFGIIQTPFYRSDTIPALAYGGIGSMIGHEFLHGFDVKGSKRNWDGSLNNWWTKESHTIFDLKTKCYEDFYADIPLQSAVSNDELKEYQKRTKNENLADNEGLSLSWKVYQKNKGTLEKRLIGLEQYSQDQLFFIAYSQIWCSNYTPKSYLRELKHSIHSPNPLRVTAALRNHPEFSRAFGCKFNSKMVAHNVCSLWFARYLTKKKLY